MEGTTNEIEKNAGRILSIALLLVFALTTFGVEAAAMVEMSRNVQSGNTQNLKSSVAPVRLPAAPASTPGTSQAVAQAGCVYAQRWQNHRQ